VLASKPSPDRLAYQPVPSRWEMIGDGCKRKNAVRAKKSASPCLPITYDTTNFYSRLTQCHLVVWTAPTE
jgi:hypothetical protein